MMRPALGLLLLTLLGSPAAAVEPDEILDDPTLEARARDISKDLRCVVCQNQSIDDSNAEIARDLRLLVRERLVAGDTDGEVVDYVVARYGDYVLLKPPFKIATYPLWLGPPVMTVIAVLLVFFFYRSRQQQAASREVRRLTTEERARLDQFVRELSEAGEPKAESDPDRREHGKDG
ncbi:MAG: cytochrome c-type biogenesis protein [Alphaproteobacteria bacterium]